MTRDIQDTMPAAPARRTRRTPAPAPESPVPAAAKSAPHRRRPAAPAPEHFRAMVAEAAYFRAERRGFLPGAEIEDWLAAEAEVASSIGRPAVPAGVTRKAAGGSTARAPARGRGGSGEG